MRRRSRSAVLLAASLALLMAAPASSAGTRVVEMRALSYSPSKVTFAAPGSTIRWRNVTNPNRLHDVVSSLPDYFGSQLIGTGQSYRFTFVNAGSFTYICTIHDVMLGRVEVAPTVVVEPDGDGSRLVITIATTRFAEASPYRTNVFLKGPGDAAFTWRRTSRARVVRLAVDRPGDWSVMVRVRHRPSATASSDSPTVTVTVPA
jgi:plastocyanin